MSEEYPEHVRLADIKGRKGHLCQGGHFDLREGPVCGCGVVLDTVPDFLPPVGDDGRFAKRSTNDDFVVARGPVDYPNEMPPVVSGDDSPPALFTHASGEPCYGCQSCFANAYDPNDPEMDRALVAYQAEQDAVAALGGKVIAEHAPPDLTPSVPPVDPTMPYGPAEVEKAILDAVRRLEKGLVHEANLIAATEQLKIDYELAYARAIREATDRSADQRKASATLASEVEYRALHDAMAARDAMKAICHTLRSTLSGLQSVGRSVGVSYQVTPGRGR